MANAPRATDGSGKFVRNPATDPLTRHGDRAPRVVFDRETALTLREGRALVRMLGPLVPHDDLLDNLLNVRQRDKYRVRRALSKLLLALHRNGMDTEGQIDVTETDTSR